MTYIKMPHVDADDERWIDAGSDAFAMHFAAMVWCDRRLTDGRITRAMAQRVSLAVPPDRSAAAIQALLAHGFWREETGGELSIVDFLEHAFPAEQVRRTRQRWKDDKDRRRQHGIGDHSLCKDPKFCPAIGQSSTASSTVESAHDATSGRSHLDQTRPDSTRPDRRSGNGRGETGGDSPAAQAHRVPPHDWDDAGDGLTCQHCPLPRENGAHA